MNCPNCGAFMPDGTVVCPSCGSSGASGYPSYNQTGYGSYQSYSTYSKPSAEQSSMGTKMLVFGIISVCVPALVAVIFGALVQSNAKKYIAQYGALSGKAKVGKILGTIGLIWGIVSCAIAVVYILVFVVALGGAACASTGSYSDFGYYLINLFH